MKVEFTIDQVINAPIECERTLKSMGFDFARPIYVDYIVDGSRGFLNVFKQDEPVTSDDRRTR